jgi:hypothetical protein
MTQLFVSIDKAGDVKLGKRKCRLHKKGEVVKVAKKYGVPDPAKKTIKQLCTSIKTKAGAPSRSKGVTKDDAVKRIDAMKISNSNKTKLRALFTSRSPRHVLVVARELRRLQF